MRALLLFTWLLLGGFRLVDPVVHSLLHHHDHCAEQGQHLHEGDYTCKWTDPAYLVAVQPPFIGYEILPGGSEFKEPVTRVTEAEKIDFEAIAPRGPPVG